MIGEAEQVAAPPHRRSELLPILTLFLLLLAFFVLLGAISKFEVNRTQAVLGSLNATFRATDPEGERREFGALSGQILGAERLESQLDRALRTVVGVDRFDLDRYGSRLALTLPIEHLFQPESAVPLPGVADISDVIADALTDQVPGVDVEPEVYVAEIDNPDLASERATAIGRSFAAAGVDPRRISIGISGGATGTVEVMFRVLLGEGSQ